MRQNYAWEKGKVKKFYADTVKSEAERMTEDKTVKIRKRDKSTEGKRRRNLNGRFEDGGVGTKWRDNDGDKIGHVQST